MKHLPQQVSASDVSAIGSLRGILDDPRIKGAVSVVRELGILDELHNPFKALEEEDGNERGEDEEGVCGEDEGGGRDLHFWE